jgi:hypothetical protein
MKISTSPAIPNTPLTLSQSVQESLNGIIKVHENRHSVSYRTLVRIDHLFNTSFCLPAVRNPINHEYEATATVNVSERLPLSAAEDVLTSAIIQIGNVDLCWGVELDLSDKLTDLLHRAAYARS